MIVNQETEPTRVDVNYVCLCLQGGNRKTVIPGHR